MMQRNERRRHHYKLLKDVGYTRQDATRYKDRATSIVEALVELKRRKDHELMTELEKILNRGVKS